MQEGCDVPYRKKCARLTLLQTLGIVLVGCEFNDNELKIHTK
jgi:hypothetical protein